MMYLRQKRMTLNANVDLNIEKKVCQDYRSSVRKPIKSCYFSFSRLITSAGLFPDMTTWADVICEDYGLKK